MILVDLYFSFLKLTNGLLLAKSFIMIVASSKEGISNLVDAAIFIYRTFTNKIRRGIFKSQTAWPTVQSCFLISL